MFHVEKLHAKSRLHTAGGPECLRYPRRRYRFVGNGSKAYHHHTKSGSGRDEMINARNVPYGPQTHMMRTQFCHPGRSVRGEGYHGDWRARPRIR